MSKKLPFFQISPNKPRGKREQPEEPAPQAGVPEANEDAGYLEALRAFDDTPEPAEQAEETAAETASEAAPDGFALGMDAYRQEQYPQALETFLISAGQGKAESQFMCGYMYQQGIGTEVNCRQALTWYRRDAKQGFLEAQLACAAMYETGSGTEINLKKALSWYEQAAKAGSVKAQLKCGRMYYSGRAETRNPKKARSWLETAAGNGSEEARRLLQEQF